MNFVGVYSQRACFLNCQTVQENSDFLLNEEIDFRHVFKVSKDSKHFSTIKKLLRRYFEAGMLDQIFRDIHKRSHK